MILPFLLATVVPPEIEVRLGGPGRSGAPVSAYLRFVRSSSAPESEGFVGDVSRPFLKAIGYDRIRLINAENGGTLASDSFVPSERLRHQLDGVDQEGLRLHLVVGQTRPLGIDLSQGWNDATKGWYAKYAEACLRWIVTRPRREGLPRNLFFEITNEVDSTAHRDNLWTLGIASGAPMPPVGSEARFRHTLDMVKTWVEAGRRVHREHPNWTIRSGGPALTLAGMAYAPFDWYIRFIREADAGAFMPDVFTYHYYGDQGAVGDAPAHPDIPALRQQVARIRTALKASKKPRLPIEITEWGPTASTQDPVMGTPNDEEFGAAWAATFLRDAVASGVSGGTYLLLRDNFGRETTGVRTEASLLHRENGKDRPKPVYRLAQMLTLMRGAPISVMLKGAPKGVGALAFQEGRTAWVLLFNYLGEHDYRQRKVLDHSQPVRLRFGPGWRVEAMRLEDVESKTWRRPEASGALDLPGARVLLVRAKRTLGGHKGRFAPKRPTQRGRPACAGGIF